MSCDSFLIKKLLKSEICGSREQYTRPTGVHKKAKNHGSAMHEQCTLSPKAEHVQKKKKKNKKKTKKNAKCRFIRIQTHTKPNLVIESSQVCIMLCPRICVSTPNACSMIRFKPLSKNLSPMIQASLACSPCLPSQLTF